MGWCNCFHLQMPGCSDIQNFQLLMWDTAEQFLVPVQRWLRTHLASPGAPG